MYPLYIAIKGKLKVHFPNNRDNPVTFRLTWHSSYKVLQFQITFMDYGSLLVHEHVYVQLGTPPLIYVAQNFVLERNEKLQLKK